MEATAKHIKVQRTARYFLYGDLQEPHSEVVFVIHGYGMKAADFLKNFAVLQQKGRLIVAPEGLSRFYRKGFTGDVVASWMTKEDRLHEIADYISYLDILFETITAGKNCKTIVLGFSQGATTASRWIMSGKSKPDELIVWCGEFAKDSETYPNSLPRFWHVSATKDEFISLDRYDAQSEYFREKGIDTKEYRFEGGHIIDQPTLIDIWDKLSD
ncbi:MAG: phospholipase [Bacteroidetes bacterium]|nr:phospholipase [Bacteroidota bacterium]